MTIKTRKQRQLEGESGALNLCKFYH